MSPFSYSPSRLLKAVSRQEAVAAAIHSLLVRLGDLPRRVEELLVARSGGAGQTRQRTKAGSPRQTLPLKIANIDRPNGPPFGVQAMQSRPLTLLTRDKHAARRDASRRRRLYGIDTCPVAEVDPFPAANGRIVARRVSLVVSVAPSPQTSP